VNTSEWKTSNLHTKVIALERKLSSTGQFNGGLDGTDGRTVRTVSLVETSWKKQSRETKIKVFRLCGELSEIDGCQEMEICLHLNGLSFLEEALVKL
jgi:hypothetical protein